MFYCIRLEGRLDKDGETSASGLSQMLAKDTV